MSRGYTKGLVSGEARKFFQGAKLNIKKLFRSYPKPKHFAQCIKLEFWTNSKGLRS